MIINMGDLGAAPKVERIDFETGSTIVGKGKAKPKAKAKPKTLATVAKAAAGALATSPPPFVPAAFSATTATIFGLPQKTFYIGLATLLAAGGYYMFAMRGASAYNFVKRNRGRRSVERRVANPRGGAPQTRLEKAKKFREEFHWGLPTNSVVTRKVHKQPKVAVKLGELHAVTYRTKKHGEKVQLFEHHFEGRKPWLAMDIDNKRLHLLGGSYTVGADGIAG